MKFHEKHLLHSERGTIVGLAILLAAFVAAGTAKAELVGEILITSDAATDTVLLTPTGASIISGTASLSNFNGWNINGLTGSDRNSVVPAISVNGSVTCVAAPCTSDPITVESSATGFNIPTASFLQSASGIGTSTGTASLTLQNYSDSSNTLFGTASPLPGVTLDCSNPPSPNACSQSGPNGGVPEGPSPYSMTTIVTGSVGTVGGTLQLTSQFVGSPIPASPIPEPPTLSLLGISFAMIVGAAYWRRKSGRVPDKAGVA